MSPGRTDQDQTPAPALLDLDEGPVYFLNDVRPFVVGEAFEELSEKEQRAVLAELFPLSAVVQRMRKTRQTSRYLARLGPFFVGRAPWQAALA